MSNHVRPSPPAVTYTPRPSTGGYAFACKRCGREHPLPTETSPVRCECGWRYEVIGGVIHERFAPRIGA